MAITAQMVKELRDRTGAGMMDCKNALNETDGDLEEAIKFLRTKGLAAASKKAHRTASDGVVVVEGDEEAMVVLELNCETDFVARNPEFVSFAEELAALALSSKATDVAELIGQAYSGDAAHTVEEAISQRVATIGEKIVLNRLERIEAGSGNLLNSYIHGGGKIGVVVEGAGGVTPEALHDVALHVAAAEPRFVNRDEVTEDLLETEEVRERVLDIRAFNHAAEVDPRLHCRIFALASITKPIVSVGVARLVDQGLGQLQPLPHSHAIRSDLPSHHPFHPHLLKRFGSPQPRLFRGESVKRREEINEIQPSHEFVKGVGIRTISHPGGDPGVVPGILAEDMNLTSARLEETDDQVQHRAFARPVGADDPCYPPPKADRNSVQPHHIPIPFGNRFQLNYIHQSDTSTALTFRERAHREKAIRPRRIKRDQIQWTLYLGRIPNRSAPI